jgi:hypothetical protein
MPHPQFERYLFSNLFFWVLLSFHATIVFCVTSQLDWLLGFQGLHCKPLSNPSFFDIRIRITGKGGESQWPLTIHFSPAAALPAKSFIAHSSEAQRLTPCFSYLQKNRGERV